MNKNLALVCSSLSLTLAMGCALEEGDEELVVADEAEKADDFSFPSSSDYPGTEQHCNWAFSGNCDYAVEFSAGQWGALGVRANKTASAGSSFKIRTFAESESPSAISARLYYSPVAVTSLVQATQLSGISLSRTQTGFGGAGAELRLTGTTTASMISAGKLAGYFYVALGGTDGTIRAIDLD